jgi:hypothetical protein
MSRQQLQQMAEERDALKEALKQAQYESQNLREILEAYQEHVQSARPADVEPASSKHSKKEVDVLKEQLSITSSRNAVLASEIEGQKIENASLRDIMDAMREDLVQVHTARKSLEAEHEERLGLLAEQLEKLKKNAKGARNDKRKAERKMYDLMEEIGHLKEQLALQDSNFLAVTSEQSNLQAEMLLKAKEQTKAIKQQLRDAETRERNVEFLLELFERGEMEKEDLASQHAELYQLEAELRAIRHAEEGEKQIKMAHDANSRARDAEQRLAQESAGRIKAEKERDTALQQLSIIHERFGIVDQSASLNTHLLLSGSSGMRQRSTSMSSNGTTSSNLERRFKLIQEGGDVHESLLSYPATHQPSDYGSLHGKNDVDHESNGCCCVVQ